MLADQEEHILSKPVRALALFSALLWLLASFTNTAHPGQIPQETTPERNPATGRLPQPSRPGGGRPAGEDGEPQAVKMGYLSCHVSSGWGIIFGSSRDLDCTYTPNSGAPEHYKGEITKFGADVGYLQSGVIIWAVIAPARITVASALSGHYAGATASATVGVGGGINVLVGGMHSSITLQPISIEGNNGLNVAAGVATMNLHYVFPAHMHD
jgi:hypothetical protein